MCIRDRYKRVLLKLSGEALAGEASRGLDFDVIGSVCDVIKKCVACGVQIGIVVGGGNFWQMCIRDRWKDGAMYDRLGLENLYTTILDVQVPSLTVPVRPGRNLAVIIEVAAMNNRHKKMGYNAAVEFTKQINQHFDQAMSAQLNDN